MAKQQPSTSNRAASSSTAPTEQNQNEEKMEAESEVAPNYKCHLCPDKKIIKVDELSEHLRWHGMQILPQLQVIKEPLNLVSTMEECTPGQSSGTIESRKSGDTKSVVEENRQPQQETSTKVNGAQSTAKKGRQSQPCASSTNSGNNIRPRNKIGRLDMKTITEWEKRGAVYRCNLCPGLDIQPSEKDKHLRMHGYRMQLNYDDVEILQEVINVDRENRDATPGPSNNIRVIGAIPVLPTVCNGNYSQCSFKETFNRICRQCPGARFTDDGIRRHQLLHTPNSPQPNDAQSPPLPEVLTISDDDTGDEDECNFPSGHGGVCDKCPGYIIVDMDSHRQWHAGHHDQDQDMESKEASNDDLDETTNI